jgi:hypothetical protein
MDVLTKGRIRQIETDNDVTAIRYHLQRRLAPAQPPSMIAPCVMALRAMRNGSPNRAIGLPPGTTYHDRQTATARELYKVLHLEPLL